MNAVFSGWVVFPWKVTNVVDPLQDAFNILSCEYESLKSYEHRPVLECSGKRGRPSFNIPKNTLKLLLQYKFRVTEIASMLLYKEESTTLILKLIDTLKFQMTIWIR